MSRKAAPAHTAESVTAMLAVLGVALEPARAAGVATTINAQVTGLNKAVAAIAFETEPATYLKVSAGEAS